jgi:hypothetical protein
VLELCALDKTDGESIAKNKISNCNIHPITCQWIMLRTNKSELGSFGGMLSGVKPSLLIFGI